jgi:hypothetical protein
MLNVYIKNFEPEIVIFKKTPKLQNCQPQGCKIKQFKKKLYNKVFCKNKKKGKNVTNKKGIKLFF